MKLNLNFKNTYVVRCSSRCCCFFLLITLIIILSKLTKHLWTKQYCINWWNKLNVEPNMSRYAKNLLKLSLLMRSDHCQSHHARSKMLKERKQNKFPSRRPRTDWRVEILLCAPQCYRLILQTSSHISKYIKTIDPNITRLGHIIMNLEI